MLSLRAPRGIFRSAEGHNHTFSILIRVILLNVDLNLAFVFASRDGQNFIFYLFVIVAFRRAARSRIGHDHVLTRAHRKFNFQRYCLIVLGTIAIGFFKFNTGWIIIIIHDSEGMNVRAQRGIFRSAEDHNHFFIIFMPWITHGLEVNRVAHVTRIDGQNFIFYLFVIVAFRRVAQNRIGHGHVPIRALRECNFQLCGICLVNFASGQPKANRGVND